MTQARTRANEVGSLSLGELSAAAMLRMFVAPVQSVVSTLLMNWLGVPHDWRTRETAKVLPHGTNDL